MLFKKNQGKRLWQIEVGQATLGQLLNLVNALFMCFMEEDKEQHSAVKDSSYVPKAEGNLQENRRQTSVVMSHLRGKLPYLFD